MTSSPASPAAAYLAETAGLIAERDALLRSPVVFFETKATDEFNAAQDRVAARVPVLAAALQAALALTVKWRNFGTWGDPMEKCARDLEEAIEAALTGAKGGAGE